MGEHNLNSVTLTELEASALALRLVAQHLAIHDDWLQWEDFPLLTESSFFRLSEAVIGVVGEIERLSDARDRNLHVHSHRLIEQTNG